MLLWIYRPKHRMDLFIVNGSDLEYTKNIFCKMSCLIMLYWIIYGEKKKKNVIGVYLNYYSCLAIILV